MKKRVTLILTMVLLPLIAACQLKDEGQKSEALAIQQKCDTEALKKWPIKDREKRFSEPVYINQPTGELSCKTKEVLRPSVSAVSGFSDTSLRTTCNQVTERVFSHNKTWTETVDVNLKRRKAAAKHCKENWCDANFDNSYWTMGFNDAERCLRTK
jgi:hypothetical protein